MTMNDEFAAIVGKHIRSAERDAGTRSDLLDRYMGEPMGNELANRSQVVTSEVFDTIEAATAELMDMMASEQNVASFPPMGPDDEQQAADETDACNHIFWEKNNGFEFLQTFTKAGLIEQVGYCRSGWVETEEVEIDQYTDLSMQDAMALFMRYASDEDITDYDIVDAEGFTETDDGDFVLDDDATVVSFKIRCTKIAQEYKIEAVAQNSVMLTPRWHKVDVSDIPFIAIEHSEYTRSDLVAMGFDRDDVDKLSDGAGDEAEDDRHHTRDNEDEGDEAGVFETEPVRVYECWVLVDDDDDGIAERYKVWMDSAGRKVLRWEDGTEAKEEIDSVEISAWTPIMVPHRHVGRAMAETIDDLQAINTVLMRHTLDSVYGTLFPRPVIDEQQATEHTFTDAANLDHGAPIRTRGPSAIQWQLAPSVAPVTLPLMEKINAIKEERTGVTRLNQGMDAETLNKTATGQSLLLTQGQKRLKLIARNLAEGVRDIFLRMHRDLRRGNVSKITYRSDGQWLEQNPMTWKPRKGMNVSIGTGNGDRTEKQQTIMIMGNLQRELQANGSSMVSEEKIFKTADRLAKMGGFSGAGLFLNKPDSPEYAQAEANRPEPQPDPNLVLAQAEASKAQAQAGKYEADALLTLEDIKLKARKQEMDHEYRMAQLNIQAKKAELDEVSVASKVQTEGEKQDLAELKQAQDEAFRRDQLVVDTLTNV